LPPKRSRDKVPKAALAALKPLLKPLLPTVIAPVVEPVVQRLDRHEELLLSLQASLDVQFQRIAAMQAQLDMLIAAQRTK